MPVPNSYPSWSNISTKRFSIAGRMIDCLDVNLTQFSAKSITVKPTIMVNHLSTRLKNNFIAIVLISFLSTTLFAQSAKDTTVQVIKYKSGQVKLEQLASLSEPWGMSFLPDGRLLVTEKPGRLRIYSAGKLSEPITGIPKVEYYEQGGLMDVDIDPGFASNNLVYIYYVERAEQQPPNAKNPKEPRFGDFSDTTDIVVKGGAVARGRLEGNSLRDVKVIWRQEPKMVGRGHFGGRMVFAPDGKLFITSGDRMYFDPAQNPAGNLGKIVRINPDGTIPNDNPFANKAGTKADIWSMGHRNPLGAAINPVSKQLWMNEMGPAHGDELNIPEAGKNYGWPIVSNGSNYDGSNIPDHPTKPEYAAPLNYWYPAISPSGLMFYTGNLFSSWKNNALIGGMSVEMIIKLTLEGNKVISEERIPIGKRVRDLIQAPDGSIWLLTDYKDGELLRMTPVK